MRVRIVGSRLSIQELVGSASSALNLAEETGGSDTRRQLVEMKQLCTISNVDIVGSRLPPMEIATASSVVAAAIFKSVFTLPVNDKNLNWT